MNDKEITMLVNSLVDKDEWEAVDCIRELQSRLEALEKDAARLHGEIMHIPAKQYGCSSDSTEMQLAYKIGHRDARHAAAELVDAMQSANNGGCDEVY